MMAIFGGLGAMFFVVGGSDRSLRDRRKPPEAPRPGLAAALDAPPDVMPVGPAPSLELSGAGASAARAAQIAVVHDYRYASLHAMRHTWPGQLGPYPWRGPAWMTGERLEGELAALDSQLAGATDPLSVHTRAWIAVARSDGARLLALHAAWSAPGASVDAIAAELRPIFDRLVAASQAVHAAVAAAASPPQPGSLAALAAGCRVAPLLARLPVRGHAAGPPIVEAGGAATTQLTLAEPPPTELRALSDACLDAARAFSDANPGDQLDHHDIHQLSLATQLAINVLHEAERRRAARPGAPFISAAGNLAQQSSYLATSRRRYDPSLRPAEAEAPP
jgi:hypothetical protein